MQPERQHQKKKRVECFLRQRMVDDRRLERKSGKRNEKKSKEKKRIYHELSFTKTTFMQLTFFFSSYSTWFEFTRFYKPFFFFFEMNSPTFLPLLFLSVGFSKSFSARLVWTPNFGAREDSLLFFSFFVSTLQMTPD